MVLAVLAVVIGAMVPSFLSIRVAEQARTTAQNLKTVMNTIAAFVQSSGCVPCPASPATSTAGYGNVNGRSNGVACDTCDNAVGLLPFRSLGLPEAFAKDAYGHWLSYAVDITLASYSPVQPNIQPIGDKGLCSFTSSTTPVNVVLSNGVPQNGIVVMLLSHGANGYGAFKNRPESNTDRFPFPANASACSATAGAELCNSRASANFVAALPRQGSDPFDDVYLYLNRTALLSYLGNAGCTTAWP